VTELSIRVETIALSSTPSSGSGQIDTPNRQGSADAGSDPLDSPQRAARIGDPVPIIFGRRVGDYGGVLISPPATEARFTNNVGNDVTASYLVVLTEGRMDSIQVRDVFQQSCRVGTFTQAFDRRAGTWGPGNFITAQTGFEDSVPDCPIYCGSATGSYAGMTTGSFVNTIPNGFKQWDRQVHVFARGGMHVDRLIEGDEGPSRNVADLVLWMLRRSSRVPEGLIDMDALLAAAQFTEANGLWCNIRIDTPSNLSDWLEGNIGYFLLRESRRGGRKGLRPLLPVNADGSINNGMVPWVFTFTEDHVLPNSVELNYTSRTERLPFCVQVIWRQQPEDGLGLARTAEVRYAGSALDGPFEQHDISAFCTTETHAFRVGAYILARRRYISHRLSMSLRPGAFNSTLAPGDVVRVKLRRVASVGENQYHDYLYEVDRVARAAAGSITLELTHLPVDSEGRSLVALDVTRAVGNGRLLPTGRAPVNCDLNDPFDFDVIPDLGPWEGWEIGELDPMIYDDLLFLYDPLPEGIFDFGDGWGPGGVEVVSIDADLPPIEVGGAGGGSVGGGPGGPSEPGNTDPDWTDTNWPDVPVEDGPGGEPANTGSVSLSAPLVGYPDIWYLILEPGFVSVVVDVGVSVAPKDTALQVTLTDGTTANWDPENGQFGEQNTYTVTIPVGQTDVVATLGSAGDSPFTATSRTLSIVSWSGGGYIAERDPETNAIITPALDISTTQTYSIEEYVCTPEIQSPGLWQWNSGTSEWAWAGPEPTGWEFDPALDQWEWTGTDADWTWTQATQKWAYAGAAITGWEWLTTDQRWRRTSSTVTLTPRPEGPPAGPPSPVPTTTPPEADHYTVVAQVLLNNPPVHASTQDLELDIQDLFVDAENPENNEIVTVGTMVIPAVGRMFGPWEWNPATNLWAYPEPPIGWRWHSSEQRWQWRGSNWSRWEWRQAESNWAYTGDAITDWEWNLGTQGWDFTGDGVAPSAPAGPPITSPPTNPGGALREPPDAERWLWSGTAWSGATNAYIVNGSAPVFDGLLIGRLTYHMPLAA
jgi:hypothetical protein